MSTTKSLRLAYLIPAFPVLSETFIIEQIKGMVERGHQVDLFVPAWRGLESLSPQLEYLDLEHRRKSIPVPKGRIARFVSAARLIARKGGFNRAYLDALNPLRHGKRAFNLVQLHTAASFLHAGDYDVLHCHFGGIGIVGERLVRSGAVKAALVTSFRGADLASHYPRRPTHFRELFIKGDLHLPVSADFRRRLITAGVPSQRVAVHHDGIDLKRFMAVERRLPDGLAKLLFVGRLVEKKGVTYALEAMAKVVHAGYRAHLTIIGDGPLSSSLRAQKEALGLGESVLFAGSRTLDEVAQAMRETHVFLAPSVTAATGDQEGIPTVLKEAMSTGLPVVSTLHSGISELIDDGVSGYLARERDSEHLAEHLCALLDQPPRWAEMGRAGRRKIEREFDADRLNDDLVERYLEAIEGRLARGSA